MSGAAEQRSLPGIFLARHGETDYNRLRRFQGLLPVTLNEQGRLQSAELAERASSHGFATLYTSPLVRARETAEIVAERLGLEPREDARLVETDAGDWTDRLFSEVEAEDPERFAAFARVDPDFAFPGGESFAEQTERVMAALEELIDAPKPTLVVCHGMVIRLALARLGRPQPEGFRSIGNAELVDLAAPPPREGEAESPAQIT